MSEPTNSNVQVIENASMYDVRPGDHITWEKTRVVRSVTATEIREGIAHHRNEDDAWCAEDGMWIAPCDGEGITITIRRTAPELPTEPDSVIERAEGHEYITATVFGETYRAREAILSGERWLAVWRGGSGQEAVSFVRSHEITPGTWKVDDR